MISRKHLPKVVGVLVLMGLLAAACGAPATPVVKTVVVEKAGETVIITATPEPTEEPCDNPFLGSCKLDGNGIPPDFFMDEHVRKGFNYCFDWDTFISDALAGEGVQNNGYLIPGMLGYEVDGPHYSYDLDKCKSELDQAWGGKVAENGFRMQIAYNTGNVTRQTVAEILQANLSEVDERYVVEIVGLPWPAFLAAIRAKRVPIFISGWIEDIHDPHNWAQPFLVGTYARRQNLPEDLAAQLKDLVSKGVAGATPAEREATYHELNQVDYDNAIAIRLAVATVRTYMQKYVEGYFYNPINELMGRINTLSKSADAPDPTTLTWATIGDMDTLDTAWNYENFGGNVGKDIYDQLITYNGPDATSFVPSLAESWDVSDDGLTYTFHIRQGVKFHEGQDLTPEDVAYTFQRGLLQGGTWSPQWLLTEPFFGTGIYDIAELVDPEGNLDDDAEALQAADPAALMSACETVTGDIVADDAAGTVTMTLSQPWAPFIPTLAQTWGSIIDKDWAIENGAWDGDCANWQNFYGIDSSTAPLRAVANGTGPYKLDHWTPGEEVVLVANEDYWGGAPAIKRVVILEVDEWGTRYAMLQTGDVDIAYVPRQFIDQVDPMVADWCEYDVATADFTCEVKDETQPLRLYKGAPSVSRTDAFFIFNITH